MKPGEYKKWQAGEVNKLWEVLISARDILSVDDVINGLVYILTDAGADRDKRIDQIKTMTGEDIIKGLLEYRLSHVNGVKKGLKNGEQTT